MLRMPGGSPLVRNLAAAPNPRGGSSLHSFTLSRPSYLRIDSCHYPCPYVCPQEINNIKVLSILFHLVLLVPPAMSAILSLSCLPSILMGQCHEICISIIFPAKLSNLGSWLASWSCFEYCLDFACITNTDLEKIVPRSGSNSPWIKSQIQMSATHCWLHVFE